MTRCRCTSYNGFLTERGLAELAQRSSLEGLAPRGENGYLDKVGSVSATVEGEELHVFHEELIEEQHRRFLHGS